MRAAWSASCPTRSPVPGRFGFGSPSLGSTPAEARPVPLNRMAEAHELVETGAGGGVLVELGNED